MKLKVMLAVALFAMSHIAVAHATSPFDQLVQEIQKKLGEFGDVKWKMTGTPTAASSIFYFQMKSLNFPGSEKNSKGPFPVIFTITCAQMIPVAGTDSTTYFCTASPPGSVGVPSSFPTAFSVDLP